MGSEATGARSLRRQIQEIREATGTGAIAVALHDYETHLGWSYHGERWFHAASTIKVPVLLGIFGAVHTGKLSLGSRVHVRNRFLSVAGGESFRVGSGRDANSDVHAAIGQTMEVGTLARHMIVTSSNLATNLLIDVVGREEIQHTLAELRLDGIEFVRGVEDERAFEAGISNRVTAEGLIGALRLIAEERAFSAELSAQMLEILHGQEFRSGIPAGLPNGTRVAHKTGEISTVAHDAGIVYADGREPYAIAILTEFDADSSGRKETIARISRAVWEHLAGEEGEDG